MKIATEQINLADALRAVADGGQVQAIWVDEDGTINFYSLNRNIDDITKIADAFLLVAEADPVDTVDETVENSDEDEDVAESQQDGSENCETAAPEVVVTDPDTTPITVEIPNSHLRDKMARWQLDDDQILRLKKDGVTERQIAEELGVTQATIHNHVQKMKREGRL